MRSLETSMHTSGGELHERFFMSKYLGSVEAIKLSRVIV